jgi:ribonuclease BN (tRNA processing enzyme)
VSDLPALLWLSEGVRDGPLPISGPSGNEAFTSLDELLDRMFDPTAGAFRVLSATLGGPWRGVRLEPTTVDVAGLAPVVLLKSPGLTVQALSVPHTNSPALAYRVEVGEASIVFSGDQTGLDPRFVDFARGVDILVMRMAIAQAAAGTIRAWRRSVVTTAVRSRSPKILRATSSIKRRMACTFVLL